MRGDIRGEMRGEPTSAHDTCRLETEYGSVDVALETQLATLQAAWRNAEPVAA